MNWSLLLGFLLGGSVGMYFALKILFSMLINDIVPDTLIKSRERTKRKLLSLKPNMRKAIITILSILAAFPIFLLNIIECVFFWWRKKKFSSIKNSSGYYIWKVNSFIRVPSNLHPFYFKKIKEKGMNKATWNLYIEEELLYLDVKLGEELHWNDEKLIYIC